MKFLLRTDHGHEKVGKKLLLKQHSAAVPFLVETWTDFCSFQMGTAALIHEFLASSLPGKGTRCCQCEAAFLGMKGPRVWRLQNFTIIFQNATEASQCVAELDALHGTLEWSGCEAVMGKPELQWRPQSIEEARNMVYLLRKCAAVLASSYHIPIIKNSSLVW